MELESLDGCPEHVHTDCNVSNNHLTSLEHGPKYVGSNYSCTNNFLTSLKFGPINVGGDYDCSENNLTTLNGAPRDVKDFSCAHNKLVDLEGAPSIIKSIYCRDNDLKSLENKSCPEGMTILQDISCYNNGLESLHMIHKHFKSIGGCFYADRNPLLKSHLLGLLLIPGLAYISIDDTIIGTLLNQYLAEGNDSGNKKKAMLQCQQALIEAGFEEAAQL